MTKASKPIVILDNLNLPEEQKAELLTAVETYKSFKELEALYQKTKKQADAAKEVIRDLTYKAYNLPERGPFSYVLLANRIYDVECTVSSPSFHTEAAITKDIEELQALLQELKKPGAAPIQKRAAAVSLKISEIVNNAGDSNAQ